MLGETENVEELDCDAVKVAVDDRACNETVSERDSVVENVVVIVVVPVDETVWKLDCVFRVFVIISLTVLMVMLREGKVRVKVLVPVRNGEAVREEDRVRVGLDADAVASSVNVEVKEGDAPVDESDAVSVSVRVHDPSVERVCDGVRCEPVHVMESMCVDDRDPDADVLSVPVRCGPLSVGDEDFVCTTRDFVLFCDPVIVEVGAERDTEAERDADNV